MGNPPMNVFEASIENEGNELRLRIGKDRVPIDVSAVARAALETAPGKPVTAGIRAEAISVADDGREGTLAVTIEQVELLGHETLVAVKTASGVRMLVRLAALRDLAAGSVLRLALDPARIYLFGADGCSIPGSAPSVTRTR